MKTFKEISAQCERIMSLFLKGYGTRKMIEKTEQIYFNLYRMEMA